MFIQPLLGTGRFFFLALIGSYIQQFRSTERDTAPELVGSVVNVGWLSGQCWLVEWSMLVV